jgi:arylsulfatase A-like enzyme
MLRSNFIKGIGFGIVTGLLITICDSLFMFIPGIYVPFSYPLLLLIFNSLFWMFIGGVAGFIVWLWVRRKGAHSTREHFYWTVFFLLPFALIYGFLGRYYLPPSFLTILFIFQSSVFDHHLSFVWVSGIIIFLMVYFKNKQMTDSSVTPLSFTLEIITCILLFQFCSNIEHIPGVYKPFFKYAGLFRTLKWDQQQYLILAYILGTLFVVCVYFSAFFAARRLPLPVTVRSNWWTILLSFVCIFGILAIYFPWKHSERTKQLLSVNTFAETVSDQKTPPVILIVLDTVRADHLSMYGYSAFTKHLEAFSRDALIFENCIANSSWTLPSHASILTGLYPTEHGCHGNINVKWGTGAFGFSPPTQALPENFITLPEILASNGYQTGAIISNFAYLNKGFMLNQGFHLYDSCVNIGDVYRGYPFHPVFHLFCFLTNIYPKGFLPCRTADDINRECFTLLDSFTSSPFFLFINYMDAHGPYSPPRPFNGYYFNGTFPQLNKLGLYLRHYILKQWNNQTLDPERLSQSFLLNMAQLVPEADRKPLRLFQIAQYDGAIAYLDDELGKLFVHLKEHGLYEKSLIIVTSDHGELFGEQGLYDHRVPMYEGVMRVPLLIKFPFNKQVGREKTFIQLSDIMPTILSICRLPIPDGISGKPFGNHEGTAVGEFEDYSIGQHRVLYDGQYKYMHYERGRSTALYNLTTDPLEHKNISAILPEISREEDEKLDAWIQLHRPKYSVLKKPNLAVSKEVQESLKSLGYIQ